MSVHESEMMMMMMMMCAKVIARRELSQIETKKKQTYVDRGSVSSRANSRFLNMSTQKNEGGGNKNKDKL